MPSPRASRRPLAEYRALPLRAHAVLAGVPLRDVTAIDLPGGGSGRTLEDLRATNPDARLVRHPVARALFGLRLVLGRLFGWDAAPAQPEPTAHLQGLPDDLRRASRLPPGTREGAFHYLYLLPDEAVLEIRNGTVHAFLCSHLAPTSTGYRFYWGIYVAPVSWFTPIYMALIEPFRRFIVYPAIFKEIARGWRARYG